MYDTFLFNLDQSISPLLEGVSYNDFSNKEKRTIIDKNLSDNHNNLFNKICSKGINTVNKPIVINKI